MCNRFMTFALAIASSTILLHAEIKHLASTESLEQIINETSQPIVVKFFTPWCSSCISMSRAKVLEKVSQDPRIKGRVLFIEVDAEQHSGLLQHWNVYSVPHIFFISKGIKLAEHKGSLTTETLRSKIMTAFAL